MNEEFCMPQGTFTIDRVPPKSTYMDRNRSDLTIPETYETPSEEVVEELISLVKQSFKKEYDITREIMEKLFRVTTELDAREYSSNSIIQEYQSVSWNELCDIGINLFEQLKSKR